MTTELLPAEPELANYEQAKERIAKLNRRELEKLAEVAFPMPRPFIQGNNATLRKLHRLGLIEAFEEQVPFLGSVMMTVRGWQLPFGYPAHIALCERCAEEEDAEDAAPPSAETSVDGPREGAI